MYNPPLGNAVNLDLNDDKAYYYENYSDYISTIDYGNLKLEFAETYPYLKRNITYVFAFVPQ